MKEEVDAQGAKEEEIGQQPPHLELEDDEPHGEVERKGRDQLEGAAVERGERRGRWSEVRERRREKREKCERWEVVGGGEVVGGEKRERREERRLTAQ